MTRAQGGGGAHHARPSRDGRRPDERGTAIVEFAIILPLLVLLLCGIIDFGTNYNDFQALRSGVRDGTRDAVVTNWGTTTSCASTPSGGTLSSPVQNIICRVKTRAGLGNNIRVGVWAPGGWQTGATLRVCAQRAASSMTGVTSPFLNGRVMTAKVEMRIEQPAPSGVTFTDGQETALSSWPTSCSVGS